MTQASGELSEYPLVVENPRQHRSDVCEAACKKMTGALGKQFGAEVTGELPVEPAAEVLDAEQSRFIGGVAAERASELLN